MRITLICFFLLFQITAKSQNKAERSIQEVEPVTTLSRTDMEPSEEVDSFGYAWEEPKDKNPALYEKIEWFVQIPASVEQAVSNWIYNDQNKGGRRPAINPFDPEQFDLSATITYTKNGTVITQPVFGFFYEDYERMTNETAAFDKKMEDPNNWTWKKNTPHPVFLIRWSADAVGDHEVKIKLHVTGMGNWEIDPFHFRSKEGNPANSFVSVSDNKHYFKTDDGKLYMPVGLNMTEASFGCNCGEGVSENADCSSCYTWGSKDPCCGVHVDKRKRAGMPGTKIKEYSVSAAAYVKLKMVLETLAKSGGNAFRTFFDPMVFDVEFEKLNNYYDRQYQAWEFDQLLNTCHDLNLRIELNMQYHYSVTYHSFGFDRFDWDNTYGCKGCGIDTKTTGTNGWCYNNECADAKEPIDFLTSPCAQKNYKKKLRYIIARWGYSRNIFMMELMSEMNNIGGGSVWEVDIDTDNDGQKDDVREIVINPAYYEDPKNRLAVAAWHTEMARYIKEDLGHKRHLIAADYTGQAPMDGDLNRDGDCIDEAIGENCNPCQAVNFDYSWQSPNIDIMAFSNYSAALNRWEKMTVHEYFKNSQSNGLMCGWNDPSTPDDDGKQNSPLGSYESLWKPVIHAENGLINCMDQDYTGFVKDMLTDVFGGHASSGMSWDEWSSYEHWPVMGKIRGFLNEQVLTTVNPATGDWRPDHEFSVNKGNNKKTKFAEAIYMSNAETGFAYGFMMNRSWNYYTTGTGGCLSEDRKNEFRGVDQPLATLQDVSWETDRIVLENVESGKYLIQYFDPATGAKVKEIEVKSKRNGLPLKEYPTLGGGADGKQPYFFFTAKRL